MEAIRNFIKKEPAMIVAVVIAILNTAFTISGEQMLLLELIIENIVLLIGGGVVRQGVYSPATVERMQLEKLEE